MAVEVNYEWRGEISHAELVALTESHGGNAAPGWWDRISQFSLGWVTARLANGEVVGFVNVAWDGCDHAFLLDTKTRADPRSVALSQTQTSEARLAGCEWLHVDYEERLIPFYESSCGFRPTAASLIHLPAFDSD